MKFTSKHIEEAVEAFSALPSIGRKSALRLVLYLLGQDESKSYRLSEALKRIMTDVKTCTNCHAYSDDSICRICADKARSQRQVCVVESIKDMLAIEDTQQYNGTYHILNGLISPLDGIGPDDITVESLVRRIKEKEVDEVIMAIPPSIEGETTIYYISKILEPEDVKISVIARGVSFSGDLEYADEITLGRSLQTRTAYVHYNGKD